MQAADFSKRGTVIKAISDNREFGQFEVVMLNMGNEHFVKPGDVATLKRQSPQVLNTGSGPVYQGRASSFNKVIEKE